MNSYREPPRSPHWPKVEHNHLLVQPDCLVCGKGIKDGIKVNAHHRYPFSYVIAVGRSDLELDERNLRTMCVDHDEEHHILIGHLGCYESYNPELERFVAMCRGLTAIQIRSMKEWVNAALLRPKPINQMNDLEKRVLRAELDRLMPMVKK